MKKDKWIQIRIPNKLHAKLKEVCLRQGITMSAYIRLAIQRYISRHKGKI